MNEFRRQFIEESLGKLAVLRERINGETDAQTFRETFRLAHSIKGGAQIFGLDDSVRAAAGLEDSLAEERPDARNVARGIDSLRSTLDSPGASFESSNPSRRPTETKVVFTSMPAEFIDGLSALEFKELVIALRTGKTLALAEATFAQPTFGAEFPRLRQSIENFASVIAAMPVANAGLAFRFIIAGHESDLDDARLSVPVTRFGAEVVPELNEVLGHIGRHIAEAALKSDRSIDVTILANPVKLRAVVLGDLFEILLHLTRNAAEHAFESAGRLEIRLLEVPGFVRLTVSDDGRGIDIEKVRRRAAERGIYTRADDPPAEAAFRLIFESGLSTAEKVSDYAGRGVGLDSVRAAVDRLAGKIEVTSRPGRTTFTVVFPNPKR